MPVAALVTLVIAAGFAVCCLVDLVRIPRAHALPKWAWALIICASIPLGGIVYLVVGRGDRSPTSLPPAENRPMPTTGVVHHRAGAIEVEHLTKTFGSTTAV